MADKHRNIRVYEHKHKPNTYGVEFNTYLDKFYATVDTLEEAIEVRDKAKAHYELHGQFPAREDLVKPRVNSNTGEKYISYREDLEAYIFSFLRDGKLFQYRSDSLEYAIEVKDKVVAFYEENGKFPTMEDRIELGIKLKGCSAKTNSIADREALICHECGKVLKTTQTELQLRREFISRGNICKMCAINAEFRPIHAGEDSMKYISKDVNTRIGSAQLYRLSIVLKNSGFVKSSLTLDEAVKLRKEVIEFYNEYRRMPNPSERENLFGVQIYERRPHRTDKVRSSTGHRHITTTGNSTYRIQITHNYSKFSFCCATLEEAIITRDNVLKYIDIYDHVPSKDIARRMNDKNYFNDLESVTA